MDNKKEVEILNKEDLIQKINPHLLKLYDFSNEKYEIVTQNTAELFFNPCRFDLIAKYIYIEYEENKFNTKWHRDVYKEQIRIFTNNTFCEGDGLKKNIEDYYLSFAKTITSIKNSGFNKENSIIPINEENSIIDGAHRLSISFYFKKHVQTFNLKGNVNYDYHFFKKSGINEDIADYMAHKYCLLNDKARIVNLFPINHIDSSKIEQILTKYGDIYYRKSIQLNSQAQFEIVKAMYKDEHWIGTNENMYAGAHNRAKISFDGKKEITTYIYIPDNNDAAVNAKTEIRDLIGKDNYPIHINDTHEETIILSKIYFNKHTIHFLQNKNQIRYNKFESMLEEFKSWVKVNGLNMSDFCVDASSTLSAYGLREGNDLDFLYMRSDNIETGMKLVDCHNEHAHFYDKSIDDIVCNPNNHFYCNGVKFISLEVLKEMKLNRNEAKDVADIKLIDSLNLPWYKSIIRKVKNKGISLIKRILFYNKIRPLISKMVPKNSFLRKVLTKILRIAQKINKL